MANFRFLANVRFLTLTGHMADTIMLLIIYNWGGQDADLGEWDWGHGIPLNLVKWNLMGPDIWSKKTKIHHISEIRHMWKY